jgi:hypothetical protein
MSGMETAAYRGDYLLEDDGEPLAVFLDSGPDCCPGLLNCYAREGDHIEVSVAYLRERLLASEPQYRNLHAYLSRRYAQGPGDPLNLVVDQAGGATATRH